MDGKTPLSLPDKYTSSVTLYCQIKFPVLSLSVSKNSDEKCFGRLKIALACCVGKIISV